MSFPPILSTHDIRTDRGFTLIELLVVTSIIALLISILLPALSSSRQAANRAICASNERQIGITSHLYTTDYDGNFFRASTPYISGGTTRSLSPADLFILNGYLPDDVPKLPTDPTPGPRGTRAFICPDGLDKHMAGRSQLASGGLRYTHYGYNGVALGAWPTNSAGTKFRPVAKVDEILSPSDMYLFMDSGIRQAPANITFYRGHSIVFHRATGSLGGAPHAVHASSLNALFVDGHVETKSVTELANPWPELVVNNVGYWNFADIRWWGGRSGSID